MKKLIAFLKRSTKHNYQYMGEICEEVIMIIEQTDEFYSSFLYSFFKYQCIKCKKIKIFSEHWNKKQMKYLNKCKRGECI